VGGIDVDALVEGEVLRGVQGRVGGGVELGYGSLGEASVKLLDPSWSYTRKAR
jgi:hypothetical protein